MSNRTLPRPPRVSKVNVTPNYLDIPVRSRSPPMSAPISNSDSWNHFDFTKTLSRTESKVTMRRRLGTQSTNSSIRRKNSVSLFLNASGSDVRNSGDHWQELLVNPEIPGEILCRFGLFSASGCVFVFGVVWFAFHIWCWLTIFCIFFFPLADRKKDSSLELLVHGLHLTKTDLKKMEKLTKINIHLHGE